MGKISPKRSMSFKQKRQSRKTRNRYLRPGALAQLRYRRATIRSRADIGKKRIRVLDTEIVKAELLLTTKVGKHSPSMLSPKMTWFRPTVGQMDVIKQLKLPGTPKTPLNANWEYDSRLESLPMDILVDILCHLHHDQLKAVILVSKRITKAVLLAREWHFNYATPDRSQQEMLRAKILLLTEHGSLVSKGNGRCIWASASHTPKAPKQVRRPCSRINMKDMRQIAAVLFQESTFPSRCAMPPGLPKPPCKSLAPSRVLVYENVMSGISSTE